MKTGKISNTVLKRSVLKRIRSGGSQLLDPPQIGHDCGVLALPKDCMPAGCEILTSTACGFNPVIRVCNNIAACGGTPLSAQCCVILPAEVSEQELKEIISGLDESCTAMGMVLSGGHTQVSPAVCTPVVTVTGIGYRKAGRPAGAAECDSNQDIILTKWIGIGGIREIIARNEKVLKERFHPSVLKTAAGKCMDLSVAPEASLALQLGITAMHDVSEGGIFAALWDMAEAGHVGLEVDFREIPVCQEVIEICEFLNVNPYELESSGCLLMTTHNGCDIVNIFKESGISARIIGRTTAGNDRIIRNQEEVRYLETPKPDAVYRLI